MNSSWVGELLTLLFRSSSVSFAKVEETKRRSSFADMVLVSHDWLEFQNILNQVSSYYVKPRGPKQVFDARATNPKNDPKEQVSV